MKWFTASAVKSRVAAFSCRHSIKRLFLILICFLVMALTGCQQAAEAPDADGKINVVTTIFAPYDFTREIAGDKANITMLLPPASEPHSYEPSPQEIIMINNCDVFIYVGGKSDEWAGRVLESLDTEKIRIVTLIDCVEAVEEEIVEGMEDKDDDHDHDHAGYDEHVWTSPKNAKLIVQRISNTLCEADAANAGFYEANTSLYLERLDELDAALQSAVDSGVRKTVVFGDRFPFRYLADAYELEYSAAFPGCASETEPAARTVAFLIDKIKAEKIPVVFHIELSNEKMANTISEATGAKVRLLHACHNISREDFTNGVTYLELMKRNVEALKEALS